MRNLKSVFGSLFLVLLLLFGVACDSDSASPGGGNHQPDRDATGDTTPEPGDVTPTPEDTTPGPDARDDATPPGDDASDDASDDAEDADDHELGEACSGQQMRCDGVCVTVTDNPLNCGTCGRRCGDEQACVDSQCVDAPRTCGGWAGNTCAADEFCDFPDGVMCDFADHQGVCTPRPANCDANEMARICGCDGVTYANPCEANLAGADVAREGACTQPGECDAMDARGEGDCEQVLGIVWDGDACVSLSGCNCVGADCDKLYNADNINGTIECIQHYDACIVDCRTEGCDDPETSCRGCWWTYACMPEGMVC